jgi:hypothetical protein
MRGGVGHCASSIATDPVSAGWTPSQLCEKVAWKFWT